MSEPLFSVIIATFNRAALLPRALDSLLAQTETDWEAIIVDDGSSDATAAVVRPYLVQSPQLRYIYHANRGVAFSRNRGADETFGSFITFLDSDDTFTPDHLAARRQVLDRHPDIEFLHGGVQVVGDPYVADRENPYRLIHLDECIIDATFVIRRDVFWKLDGIPPLVYSAGHVLYQNAVRAGVHILEVDTPTYIYDRTTPDSICTLAAQGGLEAIPHTSRGY
jgi:glycosyltransferase involved in cell wall biosynthesis